MGCCGGRRIQKTGGNRASETGGRREPPPSPRSAPPQPRRPGDIVFRYDGRSGLTAIGGGTGTRYRFGHPGATAVVDPRDRPSLARVPGLQQVNPG